MVRPYRKRKKAAQKEVPTNEAKELIFASNAAKKYYSENAEMLAGKNIVGTGKNGAIKKSDLVKALESK